jgi:hypothetical protein
MSLRSPGSSDPRSGAARDTGVPDIRSMTTSRGVLSSW